MSYGCADARADLGVYVLGAIEPAERNEVDRHLEGCSRCRDELASLAGLPALLRRLPDGQALLEFDPALVHEAELLPEAVLRRAAGLRLRNRKLAAAAAAGLIAAASAVSAAVSQAGHEPSASAPPAWEATVHGTSPGGKAWAWVRYAPRPWGTEVETRITGLLPGTRCQLWATGPAGQRIAAGSWTITRNAAVSWYPASVSLTALSLRGFAITEGSAGTVISIPVRSPAQQ